MSYHYSAMPPFRELFDCPSYVYSRAGVEQAYVAARPLMGLLLGEGMWSVRGMIPGSGNPQYSGVRSALVPLCPGHAPHSCRLPWG
jgi:hypothetical protein